MEKKYRYFTECYKHYTGKLYDWDEQGSPEDQDAYTRGLYHGFTMAKKGQVYLIDKYANDMSRLEEGYKESEGDY